MRRQGNTVKATQKGRKEGRKENDKNHVRKRSGISSEGFCHIKTIFTPNLTESFSRKNEIKFYGSII